MTYSHPQPQDSEIAAKIRELKPAGCRCLFHIETGPFADQFSIDISAEYRCPIHYPETSAALKGK